VAAEVVPFGGAFLKMLQLTPLLTIGDEMAGWHWVAHEVRHDHNHDRVFQSLRFPRGTLGANSEDWVNGLNVDLADLSIA
jgi:hypothetical protein